ncbi:hypothetical protein K2W90_03800 [Candidatus Babeliales bacterium]|nr:hypothetical protein [Candidatus Babeliales bacterium]
MKINLKKVIIVFFLARLCLYANLHSLPPLFFAPTSLANQVINSPQEVLEADIKNLFSTKITPIAQELKKMPSGKETEDELAKKKKEREQELRESQQRRAMQERSRPRSYSVPPYGFPRSYSRPYGGGSSSWRSPYSSPSSWGSSASNWNRPSSYPSSYSSPQQPFGQSFTSPSSALSSSDTSSSMPSSTEDKKSNLGSYKSVDEKHLRALYNKQDALLAKLKKLNADLSNTQNTTAVQSLIAELPSFNQTLKGMQKELDKLSATSRENFEKSLNTIKTPIYKVTLTNLLNNVEQVPANNVDDFKTFVGDIKETLGQANFQQIIDTAIPQAYQKRFATRSFSTNHTALKNAKKYLETTKNLIPECAAKADPLLNDIDQNLTRLPALATPPAPTPATVVLPAPVVP